MGKKKNTKIATRTIAEYDGNDGTVEIDNELLASAKEAESSIETNRLNYEEAKARYVMSKAEHRLLIARRNIAIANATEPADVEDAQREVDNARNREVKAKAIRDAAKDEWKGSEERLAKVLTEKLPLFD